MADLNRATELTEEVDHEIQNLFEYQPWGPEQVAAGTRVRAALTEAYREIVRSVPPCPTRTRALNKIVDSRMDANSAITHGGKY
jgi:hypothetical protein